MPTYDYECAKCSHRFELFQSMTAPVKRKCPECGKNALERLIGPGAGFLFKGDGFYITDYRSEGYQKDSKADSKASSEKTEKAPAKDGGDKKKATAAKKDGGAAKKGKSSDS